MKKILALIAIASFMLTSCYEREIPDIQGGSGDAFLTINLSPSAHSELSRATQDESEERKINNAYVFIFNSGGSLVHSQLHEFPSPYDTQIELTENDIVGGSDMTIAVVANIDNMIMDAQESTFASVATLDDLENLSTLMLGIEHPMQRTSSFLMSGKIEGVTLKENMTQSIDVPLYRTDAKIKFNILVDDSKYPNIEFTPTEWRIGSYAKRVKIFDKAALSEFAGVSANYGTYTSWANFEQTEQIIVGSSAATFAFYSIESILNRGTISATGEISDQFKLREKQLKETSGENKDEFKYAPAGATFVEFKGAIKYGSGVTETIADVVFKVMLGGVNKSNERDVNDFNIYRNTDYTYNVAIAGVNDIITEVTSFDGKEEPRPGAEGNVVIAEVIKELDAYNCVFTTSFTDSMIDPGLRWDVSTVFSKGGKPDAKDYKWVHFRINGKKSSKYTTTYRKYPGDTSVYTDVLDANATTTIDKFIKDYQTAIGKGTDKLLDVDQLVEVLKRCKARSDKPLFDNENKITFTVFVEENYYDYDVTTGSTAFNKMLWQKFVNTDKRVLNILSEYTQSADKESSRSSAQISFRQATIQTMYNTNSGSGSFSGFGSQFYPKSNPSDLDNEIDFTFDITDKDIAGKKFTNAMLDGNDKDDGRANCLEFVGGNWSTYIDTGNWTLKDDYDYSLFRFLLYNRDMDGDGKIDDAEIQWYLASINQLADLWIGEDSFNPASKLYFHKDWKPNNQHYMSSTVVGTEDVSVLWSSEGSSVSTLSASYCKPEELYYRIVRNFGINDSKVTKADKIYTYTPRNGNTPASVEFSRLNAKSVRLSVNTQLPLHELRDPNGNNKVPRKFEICNTWYSRTGKNKLNTGDNDGNNTWNQINGVESGYSPIVLPDNWRLPNQRELSIMYSILAHDYANWPLANHFCRTGFCDAWESAAGQNRPGFSVTNSGKTLTLLQIGGSSAQNGAGGVRPVRDVE